MGLADGASLAALEALADEDVDALIGSLLGEQ